MKPSIVFLILGLLWIFTQPGAAAAFSGSLQILGVVALAAGVAAIILWIGLFVHALIQDAVGAWMVRRRRARTGRTL